MSCRLRDGGLVRLREAKGLKDTLDQVASAEGLAQHEPDVGMGQNFGVEDVAAGGEHEHRDHARGGGLGLKPRVPGAG